MIPFLLLAAATAQAAAPDSPDEAKFRSCTALVRTAPERALEAAGDWRINGGGIPARLCLGLAYSALERWASAATVFEQAAMEAEAARDPRVSDLWVQSGNASLAQGDAAKAIRAFDAALATTSLAPQLRGEVHLDRGRALVAKGDLAAARADVDKGVALVPADPFGWYLSAALARGENDLKRAAGDIAKAVELAPDDADVLLQAGNVAGLSGDLEAARSFYARAVRAEPDSDAGRRAQAALAANPAEAKPVQAPAATD